MSDFADKLAGLTSREASEAKGDPERLGAMVETVARALGFTVSIACAGDSAAIDEMMAGAEGYAHTEAVEKAPFARFMHEMRRTAR